MTFDLRVSSAEDIPYITDLVLDAGGGIFEQLFEDVLPGVGVRDVVGMAVSDEKNPLNYRNALVAAQDGVPQGLALCYSAAEYGLSAIARTMVPRARLEPIRHVLASRIDPSLYINTLAVAAQARGLGLARLLLETASALAESEGFDVLSLHTWMDNAPAMRLYRELGFVTAQVLPISSTPYLKHAGPIALMSAPLLGDPREARGSRCRDP